MSGEEDGDAERDGDGDEEMHFDEEWGAFADFCCQLYRQVFSGKSNFEAKQCLEEFKARDSVEAKIGFLLNHHFIRTIVDKELEERLALRRQRIHSATFQTQSKQIAQNEDDFIRDVKSVILDKNLLEVVYSPFKGRHLRATTDIGKDEAILTGYPFVSWLKPSLYTQFCSHCLKQLPDLPISCINCDQVNYCTEMCRIEGWDLYHRMECDFIEVLIPLSAGHLALRMILMTGIQNVLRVYRGEQEDIFKCNTTVVNVMISEYRKVFDLVDHMKDCENQSIFCDSLGAVFLLILLSKMNIISEDVNIMHPIGALLLRHINQIAVNSFQVLERQVIDEVKIEQTIGVSVYTTISLLNHTCYSILRPLFNGCHLSLITKECIKSGEEVTFNYGPHYKLMKREERHKMLKYIYFFDCNCRACQENWK